MNFPPPGCFFPPEPSADETPDEQVVRPPVAVKSDGFKVVVAANAAAELVAKDARRISATIYSDTNDIWVGEDAKDATAFKIPAGLSLTITHGNAFFAYSLAGSDVYVYAERRK